MVSQMWQTTGKSSKNGKYSVFALDFMLLELKGFRNDRVRADESCCIMLNISLWTVMLMESVKKKQWSQKKKSGKFCLVQTKKITSAFVLNMASKTSVAC